MKKPTLFAIVFGCLTAFGFSSCIDDDDNNNSSTGLTPTEIAQCAALVKKHYTGNMIYQTRNAETQLVQMDTVSISWNIPNDSTLVIEKFPTRLLTSSMKDNDLKQALAEAVDQDINCFIGFINTSPVTFLVFPYSMTYNLNYGEKDHKVQVVFYVNTTYSYGSFDVTSNTMEIQILEAAIFEDERETDYLSAVTPFYFIAKQ